MHWNDLEQFMASHALSPRRVGVAVSGGKDSMVLWHLCQCWAAHAAIELFAIHINHHLRGKESIADQDLAERCCASDGAQVICVDGRLPEDTRGESVEMAARRIRYDTFTDVVAEHDLDCVLLAHHANDQAETLLMRVGQGTGLIGLQGMQPARLHEGKFPVARPLLGFSRRDIDAYAQEHQLQWREDGSNSSHDFMRNRVRHDVLPALESSVNGEAVQHLNDLALDAQEAVQFIQAQVDVVWAEVWQNDELSCEALMGLDPYLRRMVLQRFAVQEAGAARLTRERLKALESFAAAGSGLKKLELGQGITVTRSAGNLILTGNTELAPAPPLRLPDGGSVAWNGVTWHVNDAAPSLPVGPDTMILAPQFKDELLLLRTREPGDFVQFNSAGQRKRLQDLFVDAKIPAHRRDKWPLLALEKRILWVPGVFRDRGCRPEENECTQMCLVLQCEENHAKLDGNLVPVDGHVRLCRNPNPAR